MFLPPSEEQEGGVAATADLTVKSEPNGGRLFTFQELRQQGAIPLDSGAVHTHGAFKLAGWGRGAVAESGERGGRRIGPLPDRTLSSAIFSICR